MITSGFAYFVQNPRRISDLRRLHPAEKEFPFEVVATVTLPAIDYENFTLDMTVDRPVLEPYYALCSIGAVWKCILVRKLRSREGVLVIPKDKCYIAWAACYQEENEF